jgi:anti-sigma B factor antagonist
MGFTTERQGDTIVIRVRGQLLAGNRQELKHTVLDEIERGERRFRIDFGQASFIDSSGLGVLVSLEKAVRAQGGALRLANLNEELRTLFTLTKLDLLFQLRDDDDVDPGAGVPAPVHPLPRAGGAEERPHGG